MIQQTTFQKSEIKKGLLIQLFKGLDIDIFLKLPKEKRKKIFLRTIKEIELITKIHKDFKKERLNLFLKKLDRKGNINEIKLELSALLEYGKLSHELASKEISIVKKSELLQEINHFSRIMFLDNIFVEENVYSEDRCLREANDFSRFLILLAERKKFRDNEKIDLAPAIKNFSIPIQKIETGDLNLYAGKITNDSTNIFIIIKDQDYENAQKFMKHFYNFLRKWPLNVSLLVLDYYLFLLSLFKIYRPLNLKLLAMQEFSEDKILKIYSNFDYLCLILGKDKIKKVKFDNDETHLGKLFNDIEVKEVLIQNMNRNLIFVEESAEFLKNLPEEKIKEILNTNNVLNKFKQLFSKNKIPFKIFLQELNKIKTTEILVVNYYEKIKKLIQESEIIEELKNEKVEEVIIESGHIHADREIDNNQLIGLEIGNSLAQLFFENNIKSTKILMIDELHVVNRFNYENYLKILQKYPQEEIVFESSDLIRDIALDILKVLIRNSSKNKRYKIFIKGKNLYIETSDKIIELIEDVNKKFVLGCVLFDAAFCLYKLNRKRANEIYNNLYSLDSSFSIHKEMLNIYLKYSSPEKRIIEVKKLINSYKQVKKVNLKKVLNNIKSMPYFELLVSEKNKKRRLINVQELFYRPQQGKLNLLLKLLNLQPVFSLYFTLTQDLILENTRI